MIRKCSLLIFAVLINSVVLAQVDRSFFKAGFHAGIPVGDAAEISSFSLGLDLYQHFGISKTLDIGLATGFTNAFIKEEIQLGDIVLETEFDNVQFLPAAVFFRYYPSLKVNLGCDFGYALGINEGNEGGLYYRPTLNFEVARNAGLNFSYTGINQDNATWSTITGGVTFLF